MVYIFLAHYLNGPVCTEHLHNVLKTSSGQLWGRCSPNTFWSHFISIVHLNIQNIN